MVWQESALDVYYIRSARTNGETPTDHVIATGQQSSGYKAVLVRLPLPLSLFFLFSHRQKHTHPQNKGHIWLESALQFIWLCTMKKINWAFIHLCLLLTHTAQSDSTYLSATKNVLAKWFQMSFTPMMSCLCELHLHMSVYQVKLLHHMLSVQQITFSCYFQDLIAKFH